MPTKTTKIPKVNPKKWSEEEEFIQEWQDMVDAGIQINEDDIPDEMLGVWEEFKEDIKPKIAKKNWALWSAIFTPLILPSFVRGVVGAYELPPDAKKPSTPLPPPKPAQIVDYARQYFQDHGLELCKTLSETDLKQLKQQLIENWGKGEKSFKESFKQDYIDSKARLDTIYRTEYVTAQNEGMLARAKDAGHQFKVWNCPLDERSCPICSDLHGTTAPMEDEFPGGIMRPPAHPNCRCVITTLSEDDINQENVQEDSSYLDDVATFMKLNYRCEENPPGSGNFKCDLTRKSDKDLEQKNKMRLKEIKNALKELKAKNQSIRDQMEKVPHESSQWKELRKQINTGRQYKLEEQIRILSYKHPEVPKEFEPFLNNSDKIIKNATQKERDQLSEYISGFENSYYQRMLAEWNGKIPENTTKNSTISKIKNLDSIIGRSKIPNEITVYTGISSNLHDIADLKPGDEFEIPTYISTSRSETIANGFALRKATKDKKTSKPYENKPIIPTVLEVHMKPGSKALALENFALTAKGPSAEYVVGEKGVAGIGSQQEVLLARSSKFKVKNITETKFRGKPIRKLIVDGYN